MAAAEAGEPMAGAAAASPGQEDCRVAVSATGQSWLLRIVCSMLCTSKFILNEARLRSAFRRATNTRKWSSHHDHEGRKCTSLPSIDPRLPRTPGIPNANCQRHRSLQRRNLGVSEGHLPRICRSVICTLFAQSLHNLCTTDTDNAASEPHRPRERWCSVDALLNLCV
jgi:hypothetical protein